MNDENSREEAKQESKKEFKEESKGAAETKTEDSAKPRSSDGEGDEVYGDIDGKMTRDPRETKFSRTFAAVMLTVLLIAAGLAAALIVRTADYRPSTDTDIPFPTDTDTPVTDAEDATDSKIQTDGTETQKTEKYIRNEHKYNFLVVGIDRVAGLSDTIMIVDFDTDSGEISVVQLPRDTYVEIGGSGRKLNSTYASHGITGMRDLLERTLCINIDYYAVVYLEALTYAVDAVGGVPMDIPFDMKYSDPEQNLIIDLKAGMQILDGDHAQQFVRYRSGYAMGDLGRVNAQKQFMAALLRQIRGNVSLSLAEDLIGKILPMVDTDLSAEDCVYFAAKVLRGGGAEGLTMMTAPGRAVSPASIGGSYFVLSRSAMRKTVNDYLNVYNKNISDEIFDSERSFVRIGDEDFERIYTYAPLTPETVSGEDASPDVKESETQINKEN